MSPFCLGLPSVVSATSSVCVRCTEVRKCLTLAETRLAAMPDLPEVDTARRNVAVARSALAGPTTAPAKASTRGVVRRKLTERELSRIKGLPPRVACQVRTLLERGWFEFARVELAAGRNPAKKGWMRVVFQQILERRATRESIKLAFVEELGMKPKSAIVQASLGIATLVALDLVREVAGRIVLVSDTQQ